MSLILVCLLFVYFPESNEEPTSCSSSIPERMFQKPQRYNNPRRSPRNESACTVQNVLNFSRLKETCHNLNQEMIEGVGTKSKTLRHCRV